MSTDTYQAALEQAGPFLSAPPPPPGLMVDFDDLLHAVVNTSRPNDLPECVEFMKRLGMLVRAAKSDVGLWKILVLALVRLRYHAKAPAAVAAAADEEDESMGNGERLLFYLAVRVMQAVATEGQALAASAVQVLCNLAPVAGGTRDLCALIEHLGLQALALTRTAGQVPPAGDRVLPSLMHAVRAFLGDVGTSEGGAHAPLFALVATAAEMLDYDLTLVRSNAAGEEQESAKKRGKRPASSSDSVSAPANALMSTLSTFLPHNDRGPSGSTRRLVNSLAEVLIWARTEAAPANPEFAAALTQLCTLSSTGKDAEACVHKLQTIARRLRKELAASARASGFALATLYSLDRSAITMTMLRRGKAGDVQLLQRLASSAGDTRMLSMLAKRNVDEGKAPPFDSVTAMMRAWKPMTLQEQGAELDEMAQLDRALQRAAVAATIEQLRRQMPTPSAQSADRAVTIACIDGGAVNQVAAVVVAAALTPPATEGEAATAEAAAAAEAAVVGAASAAAAAAGSKKDEASAGAPTASSSPEHADDAVGGSAAKRPRHSNTNGCAGCDEGSAAASGSNAGVGGAAGAGDAGGAGDGRGHGEPEAMADACSPPSRPPKLLLGEEVVDVSDLTRVLALLDAILTRGCTGDGVDAAANAAAQAPATTPATTKTVQNVIDRHVAPGDSLVLFTASDVQLEAHLLVRLQAQRSTVHAHVINDVFSRMEREGAKVGDVTITLAWDDYNDLDLHVHTPAGEHISYQNRRSADGGYLDVDMNAGSHNSKEPVENVFFGDATKGIEAPRGKYTVVVQNYGYHEPERSMPVPFRVFVRKNGEVAEYRGQTPGGRVGRDSDVEVVQFVYEGRTAAPPPDEAASALSSSNLVAVTSSVGSTLDALGSLMRLGHEIEQMERARELVAEEGDGDTPLPGSMEGPAAAVSGVDDDRARAAADETAGATEEPTTLAAPALVELPAAAASMDVVGESIVLASRDAELPAGRQPARASRGRFELTSRDRLHLQLAALPRCFHEEVARAFGGGTLVELTAASLAERLLESGTPIGELRAAGYPDYLVDKVKRMMTTGGLARVVARGETGRGA